MTFSLSETPLLENWAVIVQRRWVIILTLVTFAVIALVGSFTSEPRYRATTTLHIERQSPDIFTFKDLGQSEVSWGARSDFYQTQYNILASPAVARRAAVRLEWTNQPTFLEGRKPGLVARLKGLIPRFGKRTAADPLDVATAQILGGMEVRPESRSQLVHVSWVSGDAELARDVANALADAYIAYNIESQFATTDQAQEFLVDQIAKLKQETAAVEAELQKYGEHKRILSLSDSNNTTLSAVRDTAGRLTGAKIRLAEAEATWRAVQETEPAALADVLESSLLSGLRQNYAAYEAEYSEKARRFKDDWPGMQVLKSKLDQARQRVDLEVERIAEQARAAAKADWEKALEEVRTLDELLTVQEKAAQELRRDSVEFANLTAEVKKKRETLDELRQRQIEMSLSSQLKDLDSTSTNIRVVEEARTPRAPFSPNVKKNLLLALMSGLFFGIGFAFLLEHLDNTITSVKQLSATVSLPLLAVIPRHRNPTTGDKRGLPLSPAVDFDVIAHTDSRGVVAEAFRELRTAMLLSNPGEPPRRMMVTSALPEEGKTATTINLGIVLSQLGRKVVLVDTDLRRPRLHKALRLENRYGVSTFLSGLRHDVRELAVPSGIDNLDVIPGGPTPPNPTELLDSSRFEKLAADLLASGYDHVLLDSPPALPVADAAIIANQVDVGILVVRAAKTPRHSVKVAAEKLQKVGRGKVGIVLNDLNTDRHSVSHYTYLASEPSDDEGERSKAAGGGASGS